MRRGDVASTARRIQKRIEGPKGSGRQGELAMIILARMAGVDPEGALDRLLEVKKEGGRIDREVVFFMASAAAKTDPSRMQAMIARMPDEESKKAAEMAWLSVRARQDPDGVLEELLARPPTDDSGISAARDVIRSVAGKIPEKAIEAAGKLAGPEAQSRMVGEVMQVWLDRDSNAAAKWAVESMDPVALNACLRADASLVDADKLRRDFNSLNTPNAEVRSELASSLAGNLAQQDVTAAINWSATLERCGPHSGPLEHRQKLDRQGPGRRIGMAGHMAPGWRQGQCRQPPCPPDQRRRPRKRVRLGEQHPGRAADQQPGQGHRRHAVEGRASLEQALNGLPEGERAAVTRAIEMRKSR